MSKSKKNVVDPNDIIETLIGNTNNTNTLENA